MSDIGNAMDWAPQPEKYGDVIGLEFVTGIDLEEVKDLEKRSGVIEIQLFDSKHFDTIITPRVVA